MATDSENLAALTARIQSATAVIVTINPPASTPLDFTGATAAADALDAAIAALQAKINPPA